MKHSKPHTVFYQLDSLHSLPLFFPSACKIAHDSQRVGMLLAKHILAGLYDSKL